MSERSDAKNGTIWGWRRSLFVGRRKRNSTGRSFKINNKLNNKLVQTMTFIPPWKKNSHWIKKGKKDLQWNLSWADRGHAGTLHPLRTMERRDQVTDGPFRWSEPFVDDPRPVRSVKGCPWQYSSLNGILRSYLGALRKINCNSSNSFKPPFPRSDGTRKK